MRQMKEAVLFLAALTLCAPSNVVAQDRLPLTQVEKSVKKKEPKWKLEAKRLSKMSAYYSWKSGKSFVSVFIVVYSSSDSAEKALDVSARDYELHGVEIRVVGDVPDLGDRNYQWEGLDNKKFKGISFKKGGAVAHVSGSSFDVARRFARHIADVLGKS